REPFRQVEGTMHAQVHLEISRTAKLIAEGVSKVCVGRTSNQRLGKSRRVEVVATHVTWQTLGALAEPNMGLRGPAIDNVEFAHEIGGLSSAVRVQVIRGHCEWYSAQAADDGIELPTPKNPAGNAGLRPVLSLAEG